MKGRGFQRHGVALDKERFAKSPNNWAKRIPFPDVISNKEHYFLNNTDIWMLQTRNEALYKTKKYNSITLI